MIPVDLIRDLCPRAGNPEIWAAKLWVACQRFGITSPKAVAAFLANAFHETQGLTRFVENLNYSAAGLIKTFGDRFTTADIAKAYARQPERIANRAYANKIGNGNEASGDGWKYRGRGAFQLTGRANYAECAKAIGFPLVDQPELVEQIGVGSLAAAYYFKTRGLIVKAEKDDFRGVVKGINAKLLGYDERERYYQRALSVLGGS